MSHTAAPLPFGTKSIRILSEIEDYLEGVNTNEPHAFTLLFSRCRCKDHGIAEDCSIQSGLTYSQFKWSGQPERNVHEFLDWVLTVHHSVTEKLSLRKAIFNRDGTVIAAEITMIFRGNGNFQTDNFAVKWGRYGLGMARW
jgi:hypothetical protein